MNKIPKLKDLEKIDYIRLKNDINDLPSPLRQLFIEILREIERLETTVEDLQNKSCLKCKYFDK